MDEQTYTDTAHETPVERLGKDLAKAAETMGPKEARYLVDSYYIMQKDRIRFNQQEKACKETGEPMLVLDWCSRNSEILEGQIKRALDRYSSHHPVGEWMRDQKGVGPVLAAGLLAHIDIERAVTAGHIWNFAGLNPDITWEKGQKRPWSTGFKTICAFKLGECFVKVWKDPDAFYGRLYAQRKAIETEKNDVGAFADQAARVLEKKNIGKSTDAYKAYSGAWARGDWWRVTAKHGRYEHVILNDAKRKEARIVAMQEHLQRRYGPEVDLKSWEIMATGDKLASVGKDAFGFGRLPPAHIHARARRWAVKMFLSHAHELWRRHEGLPLPKPFAIGVLGHGDYIAPPGGEKFPAPIRPAD